MLSGYYRLLESYRNHNGNVCHRTLLSAGFLDELSTEQRNLIQRILTDKVNNIVFSLFEVPYCQDPLVLDYVELFYNRMLAEKSIDVSPESKALIIRTMERILG